MSGGRLLCHWIFLIFGIISVVGGQGQVSAWTCVYPVQEVYRREDTDAQFQFDVSGSLPQQAGVISSFQIASYDGTTLCNIIYQYQGSISTETGTGVTVSADATGTIVMTLANVKLSNKGTYRIYDMTGTLGCNCLYILGIPTKPTISASGKPSMGGSVTLTCRSISTTTPSNHSLSFTYSWKVDNVENPSDSRYSYSTDRNTLTLSNLVKQDASKHFTCLATEDVSDGYSSSRSDFFSIDVRYPPDGPPVIAGYTDGGEYRVMEGTQGQLSCSVSGGNPAPILTWDCINSGTSQTTSSGTVTKIHSWMTQRGQDKTCTCWSSHYSGNRSVSIKIRILYPPTKPSFRIKSTTVSGTIKVIRNNSLSVTCDSSGQPEPLYRWTYPNGTTSYSAQLRVDSVQSKERYTCDVYNNMNSSADGTVPGSNSSFVDVLILYTPSLPTFKYWNKSGENIPFGSLDVIKGDTFKVACKSVGEPAPSYHWNNQASNQILTVNSITADQSRTCTATNTMVETVGQTLLRSATATLKINVMYPPSVVTMRYQYGESSVVSLSTTPLSIIEGNPFTVTCSSDGVPAPSYKWTGQLSSNSTTISVNSARISHEGTITCVVGNTMTRTFASPEKEKSVKIMGSFNLHVLYPPVIRELRNTSVVEGLPSTMFCPVTFGNPSETSYEWRRKCQIWKRTQNVTIETTSRTDAMFYTCTIFNVMEQTGSQPISQPDTKSFFLHVWYGASVTEFYILGHKGESSVTMNETEPVPFECNADSNPGSTISIIYREKVMHSQANIKSMAYSIVSAACTDNGMYSCVGFNNYNVHESSRILKLFINCSPRPSPFVTLNENVTSAQHRPAILTFTALAYPEPKYFKWYIWYTSAWLSVSDSEQFLVETSKLQTNLTITDVNRTYFGKYKLEVENTIGRYGQIFHLSPEDVPAQPRYFRYMTELVTKSSVTVQWSPGFDNGPDQTFKLGYKKASGNEWNTITIPDSGKLTMNYTISGLSSGTEYHVVLYATNALGNSSETEIITIDTIDDPTSENPAIVSIAVGLSVTFAVVVLVVIGLLVVRKNMTENVPCTGTSVRTLSRLMTLRLAIKPHHGNKMTEETDANVLNNEYMDLQPSKIYVNTSQDYDVLQSNSEKLHHVEDSKVYENLKL